MNKKRIAKGGILVLLLIGTFWVLNKFFPFRIDLTEEKRYSLHASTKEVLKGLKDPLVVDMQLYGDLPGGMRRFQKNIEEMVKTFDDYSEVSIDLKETDPLSIAGEQERADYIVYLAEFGINPTNLYASEGGAQTSRMIFPGVVIRNEEYETGGLLLKGEKGMTPDQILNLSVENLEFELINMIKKLSKEDMQKVAMITNHGELQDDEGYGIVEALSEEYEVYKVPLSQAKGVKDLLSFDAIIVAGPKSPYKEREIYLLDQYLMQGGKLMFCIDPLSVNMEDAGGEGTVAIGFDTGLDRLLFKYGIRINKDLVQDMNFGYYPVVAGEFGDQPQVAPLPWPFYVIANRISRHVITKGLDQMKFRFISSLDTVKADGVKKVPLVFSGNYSRTLDQPVRVAFEDMSKEPDLNLYNQKQLPLAYLLEGQFESFFNNRFLPDEFEGDAEFVPSSSEGAVIVIGDGDWLQSEHEVGSGDPLPLGLSPFTNNSYANRAFLQNSLKYLIDPDGIMATRSKVLKIRPLDKKKVKEEKLKWQLINIALPVTLIILIGFLKVYMRKRRYGG
ncbi:gliding motility-associated ABC transporter substrate-binding protein GldG [Echinicola marina]|uniref:gliding motility-associated ABC transporter substrate-binding protein GldG n=1 Tax=Echinicola marina TaxID=2859768 RepID=UPI001CF6F610|nr:gliding motility-associated ABC transporter substrate-binding protein GldG [Echinicola marina]